MGLIKQACPGLIRDYPEETIAWPKALIDPGKDEVEVKLGPLSAKEANLIILKCDMLALSRRVEDIAVMLAEEMESILVGVRMVKAETKSPFGGILGVGAQLDIGWLRPKDVGQKLTLNKDDTAATGLYAGTKAAVYTWLQTFVANTEQYIIPEQTMAEEAAVIHLGAIDTVEIPKINVITFTIAGISAPRQTCPFNLRDSFGTERVALVRWEKPVLIAPEKKQRIGVMPNISGDSKFELLSLLVGRAQDLTA